MQLTNLYPSLSLANAVRTFTNHTMELALTLYQNDWTVIGSQFKSPKVNQWTKKSREELINIALSDFQNNRANSINLRIKDNNVIALDCDFYNDKLMLNFIEGLSLLLAISPNRFYTCTGSKGGKIFFKYIPPYNGYARLASKLGITAYDQNNQGDNKQELEIKTHNSTVAGLHSPILDACQNVLDFKVYSPLPNTQYIIHASPKTLPSITKNELDLVQALYNNLVKAHDFSDSLNVKARDSAYYQLLLSSIYHFISFVAINHKTNNLKEVIPTEKDLLEMLPVYKALGMLDSIKCLDYLFYGARLDDMDLLKICRRYKTSLATNGDVVYLVLNQAYQFERLANRFDMHLRRREKGEGRRN